MINSFQAIQKLFSYRDNSSMSYYERMNLFYIDYITK